MKFRFIFFLPFLWALTHFAQKQTDGFTVAKISTELRNAKGAPLNENFLLQPYFYQGKGGQSYVFLSEDGKYVLKCFRSSKLQRLSFLHRVFPLPYFEKKKTKEEHLLQETLESYSLAFEELPQETGLLGVHLDTEPRIHASLKLIDNLGICHTIDPNQISFVLQKKALLVKDKIGELMQTKNLFATKRAIASLFSLIKSRMEKGIEDTDPNLAKNFGFVEDHVIQIDGGRFSRKTAPSLKRISQSVEDLQHWINANFPELSEDFYSLFQDHFHEIL